MSYTIDRSKMVTECCYKQKPNVQYIVMHYTGSTRGFDTAINNRDYFYNNQQIVQGSAHYFVDDNTICASVPEYYSCWGVGVI